MYFGSITNNLKVQLASLYRKETEDLEIKLVPIQQQEGGSDCGLFSAAVCGVSMALGENPATVRWRQNRMRKHLKDCFERGHLTAFPYIPAKTCPKMNKSLASVTIPLICVCRLPEYAFNYTVKCHCCSELYHKSCVYSDTKKATSKFTCFKCQASQVKSTQD